MREASAVAVVCMADLIRAPWLLNKQPNTLGIVGLWPPNKLLNRLDSAHLWPLNKPPNKLLNMLDIVPQCPLSKQLIMPVSMPGIARPWPPNKLLNMLDIVPQCPLSKQLIMPVSMPGFTVELEALWLLALPLDGAHNVPLRLPNKLPIMPVVAPPWPFSQRNKPLTMLAT